jgi:RNA polymerase sigma-70 factor (ECF subfamily)
MEKTYLRQGDLELARRAADGDRAAFHAVVDRYADDLFRLARSLVRVRADAEDIVQETFIEAFRGIGTFDGRASLRTWLSRILMRRASRVWRRSRERPSVSLEAHEPSAGDASLAVGPQTLAVDQRLDLRAVLPSLIREHREILLLREMQGMSYAEIAQTLGVPQGTVESRLHRARRELRERLKAYEPRD